MSAEINNKPYSLEDRVDNVLTALQSLGKDELVNAVVQNAEAGESIDILQKHVNIVKGAAKTLEVIEEVAENDQDFLGIAQAKILLVLRKELGLK